MSYNFRDITPYRHQIFSGQWKNSSAAPLEVRDIASQAIIGEVSRATTDDVAYAAQHAQKAQKAWAARPFTERADVLLRAAILFTQYREDFHHWLVRESGSIQIKAVWEVEQTWRTLQQAISYPAQVTGELLPSTLPGRLNLVRRIPVGVVGVITPWNFPLLLAIRSVAPALALGNAVILKPDAQTPVAGGILLARLFEEAGLPEGLFHVLPGDGIIGAALVDTPEVQQISFTGSTAVGKNIAARAGQTLKKTSLELGGNNAFVVLDDADVEIAASHGAWGAFLHQGQVCLQSGRHLVHRSRYDDYVAALAAKAKALVIGDPQDAQVQIGPMINTRQVARLDDILQRAIAQGARVVTGGNHDGLFFTPTVLADVSAESAAFREELFGPVAPVTVFDSDDEAADLVNASAWGLSVAVQSRDVLRAQQLIDRFEHVGMAHVNDQSVNNEAHVPFGGLGDSGTGGRFGGPANIEEFTHRQWLSLNPHAVRYPF